MNLRVLAFAFFAAVVLGLMLRYGVELPGPVIAGVGGLGLIGLTVWSFVRPEVGLYVLAAYIPFSKLLPGGFGGAMVALNLTNLLFMVVLITCLAWSLFGGRPLLEFHPLNVGVLLYVMWGFFSYVWFVFADPFAGEGRAQVDDLKRWLDPFVVYGLFFLGVRNKEHWRNIVTVIMVVVAVVAALAILDYMDVGEGTRLERARIGGVMGQPNFLGAFLVYYMFLFVGHWIESKRLRGRAALLLIPFLFCVRGVMVTFSRGAYLALAFGALGLAFFKNKLLALAALAALVLAVYNPWLLPEGVRYRLETTVQSRSEPLGEFGGTDLEEDLDTSSAGRLIIWEGALEMMKDYPVVGVGLGRFGLLITSYAELDKARDAHNAYLITATELGTPALLLFLFLVAQMFWVGNRVHRRHPSRFVRATALGFLGGLCGLLMANMFGSRVNALEVSGYVWVLAALMARADLELRDEEPLPSTPPGYDRMRTGTARTPPRR